MEIIFEGSVVGIRLVGIRLSSLFGLARLAFGGWCFGVRLSSLFGLARLAFGGWCFGIRLSSLFGLARLARSASPRSWGAAPPPARALPLTREEVQTPSTPTLAFAR